MPELYQSCITLGFDFSATQENCLFSIFDNGYFPPEVPQQIGSCIKLFKRSVQKLSSFWESHLNIMIVKTITVLSPIIAPSGIERHIEFTEMYC